MALPFAIQSYLCHSNQVICLELSPLALDHIPILDAVLVGLAIAIWHVVNLLLHQCAERLTNLTIHLLKVELDNSLLHSQLQLQNLPSLLQAL